MISFLFIIFSVLFFDFYLLFIVDNVYLKNNHIFTIRFKKKPIYFRKFKYYVLIICNVFYNVNSFLHLSFIFVSFDRNLKNIFVNNFLCFNVSNSHFPIPSIFEGRSSLYAPPQHCKAVKFLIAVCTSTAERLSNRKDFPITKKVSIARLSTLLFHTQYKNSICSSSLTGSRPCAAVRVDTLLPLRT